MRRPFVFPLLLALPLSAACASAPSTSMPGATAGTAACDGAPTAAARLGALRFGESLFDPGHIGGTAANKADLGAMIRPDLVGGSKPIQIMAIDIGTPDALELAVLAAGPGDKHVVHVLVCDPGRGWQSTGDTDITSEGWTMMVDADAVTTSDRKRRTALRLRQPGGIGLEFYEPIYLVGGEPLAKPIGEGGRQVLDESQEGESYFRTDAIEASGWYPDGISEAFFAMRVSALEDAPDTYEMNAGAVARSDGSEATVGEAWFLLGRGVMPAACAAPGIRCAPRGEVSAPGAWPFDWIAGAWPNTQAARAGAEALGVDAAGALWLLSTSDSDDEREDWPTAPDGKPGKTWQRVAKP